MRFGLDDDPEDLDEKKMDLPPNTEGASGSSSSMEEITSASSMESSNKRREFAMVVFHNIPETYPADAHIQCGYTITADFRPTRSDWIGLYKVGWLSTKDYIYYDWVNIPSNYEEGKDAEGHVLFPSHKLPNDDGEFYQFCYVTSSGQIRGASTPFQFKKPSADDFVEIEDEETQMLVIRSKTIVMEENIHKLDAEKKALMQMQHELEEERDELVNKLSSLERNLQEMKQENKQFSDQVKVDRQTICQLQQEAKDLIMVRDEVQQRADSVKRDRETIQEKVNRLDAEIYNLKDAVRRLQSEKDELEGENLKLKQGIDIYKQHFTKQEGQGKDSARQIEELEITLAKHESLIEHLKSQLDDTKARLEETHHQLKRQLEISQSDKENIDWLSEKIQNLEDKLSAADNVKELLQGELQTYREQHQKMVGDLVASKEENHGLKLSLSEDKEAQLTQMGILMSQIEGHKEQHQKMVGDLVAAKEENHALKLILTEDKEAQATQTNVLMAQLEENTVNLEAVQKEADKLKVENVELARRVENATETSSTGSMQCLVMAQSTLKERYSKMEHNFTHYQTETSKKQKEFKQQIKDMGREIEDLKERLTMGSNEYRNLYIENRKLQKKVEKVEKLKQLHHRTSDTEVHTLEQSQKTACDTSFAGDDAVETILHEQLDDVERELGNRQEKKSKYKIGLIEERKKVENLRKDLKQNAEEIEKLKEYLTEVQGQNLFKVRSLENYVAEKDKTIDELNRKIRDTVNLHDRPCKIQSSEGSGAASSLEKPKRSAEGSSYPYVVYGNTYQPIVYPQNGQGPIVYPPTQGRSQVYPPQVPVVYPHPGMAFISPPAYPTRNEEGQSAAGAPPLPPRRTDLQKSVTPDEAIPETDSLDPPLQPLPAPIIPERLQSAKKAEVINVLTGAEGCNSFPSAPPMQDFKEMFEEFQDAQGEGMKICPVCSTSFSADVTESNFEAHVLAHVNRICPLCHNLIENCSDEDFHHHVNKHLDEKAPIPQDGPIEFD